MQRKENINTSGEMKQMDSITLKPCEQAIFMIKRRMQCTE